MHANLSWRALQWLYMCTVVMIPKHIETILFSLLCRIAGVWTQALVQVHTHMYIKTHTFVIPML